MLGFIFFDPVYLLFMLPALLISLMASAKTKRAFSKYSRVSVASGMNGAQAAAQLLQSAGVRDVRIEPVKGFLSDHYDPGRKVLRLSPDVYGSRSLSAIGVACHEAGHAIQHARAFAPLKLRTALVPAATVGTHLSYIVIILGVLLSRAGSPLILLGIGLFSLSVVFSLVTLPVEWDASARAKKLMVSCGIVGARERGMAAEVLNAAFLTYLAAALSSVMTLLYYLLRFGGLGGDD